MKQSFLVRLQRNALLSLIGSLLLLLIVPALQILVLGPQGYGTALASPQATLSWIQGHTFLFLLYRLALLLGFALPLVMPFALFRIIIAQEIVGRAEIEQQEEEQSTAEQKTDTQEETVNQNEAMPPFAWRGKGFAVIAAWTGLLSLIAIAFGTLASTIYLWSSASISSTQAPLPDNFFSVSSLFAVLTYTIGGGLLAFSCIFFGIVIARSGRKLWPDSWVAFGYAGLGVGAIACGSAVQVALAPTSSQATLITPTIFLFALWLLWFSLMVVRLKPE